MRDDSARILFHVPFCFPPSPAHMQLPRSGDGVTAIAAPPGALTTTTYTYER